MKTNTTVCPICGEILPGGVSHCSRCGFEMHYFTLPVDPAIIVFEKERALEYAAHSRLRTTTKRTGNFLEKGLRSLGEYLLRITSPYTVSNNSSQQSV